MSLASSHVNYIGAQNCSCTPRINPHLAVPRYCRIEVIQLLLKEYRYSSLLHPPLSTASDIRVTREGFCSYSSGKSHNSGFWFSLLTFFSFSLYISNNRFWKDFGKCLVPSNLLLRGFTVWHVLVKVSSKFACSTTLNL